MKFAKLHKTNPLLSAFLVLLWVLSAQANYTTEKVWLKEGSGAGFYYHLMGKNSQPLVVIMGGGPAFSSWNLQPLQEHVAQQGYRAVLMDMLGVGENAQQIPSDILPPWIDQFARLKRQLSPHQPVILLGHSWGALMALLYTRSHPQDVAKLIFLNPVDPQKKAMENLTDEIHSRNSQENPQLQQDDESQWNNDIPENIDLEKITLRQIQQVLPTYFYDYDLGIKYAQQFTAKDFNIELNVATWQAYDANPIGYEKIPHTIPKYFLECREDYLMPYNLNAMERHWQFDKKVILEGCGHFPWIEKPQDFYPTLAEFLIHQPNRQMP